MSLNLHNKDFVSTRNLDRKTIDAILKESSKFDKGNYKKLNKTIALLFFEPSTRTHLSFSTAVRKLGASEIGFSNPKASSLAKGESFSDTIKVVERYADAIVIRHPLQGAAAFAADLSSVPIINAGDGANQHPTQAMLDLYTILKKKGKIDGLKILLVGDLKYGRTIHSLVFALSNYNIELSLYSPPSLALPERMVDELRSRGTKVNILENLDFSGQDVIYATRVQKERFADLEEYERSRYKISIKDADTMKRDAILMHPLPRIDEIDTAFDKTKHAAYFDEAANGVPVRMALLSLILGGK